MENSSDPYGTPQAPNTPQQPQGFNPQAVTSGKAITSLVCGIVGLLFFGIVLGPIAAVFGHLALGEIKRNPAQKKGKGMAIAGLVCGYVAIAFFVIALVFIGSQLSGL